MEKNKEIIGNSKDFCRILHKLKQYAGTRGSVLLEGEPGVGKDFLSRYCLSLLEGKDEDYVKLDCSLLNVQTKQFDLESLLSENFSFSQKDSGSPVLYLDHIGDLQLLQQGRLVSFLEKRSKQQSLHPESVWLISSTCYDLKKKVSTGQFREDLYYRITGLHINVPPLRERREDIPLLLNYFNNLYSGLSSKKTIEFSDDLVKILISHYWHGNIRQLETLIQGFAAVNVKKQISAKDLPDNFFSVPVIKEDRDYFVMPGVSLKDYEREIIKKNLEYVNGNRAKAAKLLGISERNLYRKIIEFNLE